MNPLDLFSPSYEVARRRFRDAASAASATVEQHRVETGEAGADLTIDVATVGAREPEWVVVVSSGVHGVEGFFGSAIQLAWLSRQTGGEPTPGDGAVVLVHAVNPYGFTRLRRTNEHNVDLNRNFLDTADAYAGAPDGYKALDPFLNPASPSSPLEPFRLKALWRIRRHGLPALKDTVAEGQYPVSAGVVLRWTRPSTLDPDHAAASGWLAR